MTYTLITEPQALSDFCQTSAPILALDTEFIRTRTFYAKPGLYQVFDGVQTVLIDPLAVSDLAPLWQLLEDSNRICVLHAGGEDIELLHQQSGSVPARIHDTQLAAAFLGLGAQIGFAPLVNALLDVQLDKANARTDWLARPLSGSQLNYAADDVIYLYPIYQELMTRLQQRGLMAWFEQECERTVKRRITSSDPALAYLDIKHAWTLDRKGLAILQRLSEWRLSEARRRDLAVNFVVKEAHLFKIAERAPTCLEELAKLELDAMEVRRHGETLLKLVQQALENTSQWPPLIQRLIDFPAYKSELKRIKGLIDEAALQASIPAEVIASKRLIHQYLSWKWRLEENPAKLPVLLQDWRGELLASSLG
ncbi:ribonuclease D [Oceanisphaera avium]|uniref:Ribonuclease D n=1 Tax=Oceanisphaera avium TaxID=1903694 RepID=A0A1Y0CVA9_9GAMM|nr:ribonuclease D [Oceanisphaera avium]ART79273.1 ribonuclease D [Oceanisphaera avium]